MILKLANDLKKIDPELFEDLCVDILESEGFKVDRHAGRGSEIGWDILAIYPQEIIENSFQERWIVQCKHKENDKALAINDIKTITIPMVEYADAKFFLLITNGKLSTSLENFISKLQERFKCKGIYIDYEKLINLILKHPKIQLKYGLDRSHVIVHKKIKKPIFNYPLKPFEINDADFFFGREKEISCIKNRIQNHRITVIIGESGVGKTSLIKAGLISSLKNYSYIRILPEPIKNICESLRIKTKIEHLPRENYNELINITNNFFTKDDDSHLLILDQFEELFTECDTKTQLLFAAFIKSIYFLEGCKLHILLSIRSDFLDLFMKWTDENGLNIIRNNIIRIERFDKDSGVEILTFSFDIFEINVTDNLINKIAEDLLFGEDHIYPPYLRIISQILINKYQNNKIITEQEYFDFGKSENILFNFLENEIFSGISSNSGLMLKQIFEVLTGSGGKRDRLTIEEISKFTNYDLDIIRKEVERLVGEKRLLQPIIIDKKIKYELTYDFLSKRFFDNLPFEKKELKRTYELFWRAYGEWKHADFLLSHDKITYFLSHIKNMKLETDEFRFLIKSLLNLEVLDKVNHSFFNEKALVPLIEAYNEQESDDIKKILIKIISNIKSDESTLFLISTLENPSTVVILEAIAGLSNIYDDEVTKALQKKVFHKKAKIRKIILNELSIRWKTSSASRRGEFENIFIESLKDINYEIVKFVGLCLIENMNNVKLRKIMIEVLKNSKWSWKEKRNAVDIIYDIGNEENIFDLEEILSHHSFKSRNKDINDFKGHVVLAIGNIGNRTSNMYSILILWCRLLLDLLDVQNYAAEALSKYDQSEIDRCFNYFQSPVLINYLTEVVTQKKLSIKTVNNINNIIYSPKYVETPSELIKKFQNTKLSGRCKIILEFGEKTVSLFKLFSDPTIGKDIESIMSNHMKLVCKNLNIPFDTFETFFDRLSNKEYSNKEYREILFNLFWLNQICVQIEQI